MTDQGRVVVTGAAGGIGAAVVRELLERDYTVDGIDPAPGVVEAPGYRHHRMDVTDADAFTALGARIDRLVGLVNVAGVLHAGSLADLAVEDLRHMVEVNVVGVLAAAQAMLPALRRTDGAGIVTVASNAARVPRAGLGGYGASKAAASMLTRSLGLEEAAHGVRCNVVLPGSTRTPMLESLWETGGSEEATIAGDLGTSRLGIPLQRLAEPVDIASAVAFLLSPAARHITLHELVVDGGATP